MCLIQPRRPISREIPAVEILRQIWVQNYRCDNGQLHWREPSDIPPASRFINSPYDQEARYGKKYSTRWTGYKVHLTETCEADQPHLLIHVATTPAPTSDVSMTEVSRSRSARSPNAARSTLLRYWLRQCRCVSHEPAALWD